MIIKTNTKITNLKGDAIRTSDEGDVTLGLAIANILLSAKDGGKMKMFSLAQKAYKDNSLEVDAADLALIKRSVESTEVYTNLISGQVLLLLEDVKEEEKKEKKA